MKKLILFSFFLIGVLAAGMAQSGGEIQGRIVDQNNEGVPFANVVVFLNDVQVQGTATDFDGYFTIKPLNPGRYKVVASYLDKKTSVSDVVVSSNRTTFLQDAQKLVINTAQELDVVEYVYKKPPVDVGKPEVSNTVSREQIDKMPKNNLIGIISNTGGTYSADDNSLNISIGGSRFGANKYIVDGVDMTGVIELPTDAIDEIQIITSGYDASIGDFTGGVINVSTRGPSKEMHGSVQFLTSQFLDPYGYNEGKFSLLGPLYTKNKGTEQARTVLGYLISGTLLYEKDTDPPALPLYQVKEEVLQDIIARPLQPSQTGEGLVERTEFLRAEDLEEIPYKPNNDGRSVNLIGKVDWKPSLTTNLTLGSTYYYSNRNAYIQSFSLLNSHNHPIVKSNTSRFYARFYQRFLDKQPEEGDQRSTGYTLSNAYYTILADVQLHSSKVYDADHKFDAFKYGYIGKFETFNAPDYDDGRDSITGLFSRNILQGYPDTAVIFDRGEANPELTNYTDQFFDANDPNNLTDVVLGGGLRNGDLLSNMITYSMYYNPGVPYTSFSKDNTQQYGLRFDASFDLKKSEGEKINRHAIEFGFEFQQRVESTYDLSPLGLWTMMRQLANSHITDLDKNNPYFIINGDTVHHSQYTGTFDPLVDTIWYQRLHSGNQRVFDRNLREKLGLPVDGLDYINIDALDPEFFTLDMFSPEELLSGGNPIVGAGGGIYTSIAGYDYYGNKLDYQPSFNDFFTRFNDKNGNGQYDPEAGEYYERPIDSYRPIYTAGYVQDRFNIGQVVFRVGVRVDRFDANQKVLRDPYSLYAIHTVGDVDLNNIPGTESHPSTIGNDYKVYVDNADNPNSILGYRNGDTWYNANGNEIFDPAILAAASNTGQITPYLVNSSSNIKVSQNFDPDQSFEDYDPQITVMPRIAFSFPITETAMFTAHYDVLTQRPIAGIKATPIHYYYLQEFAIDQRIPNPNLKPEKTINYQLGFQQALSDASRIGLSAFYKELRDMTQVVRLNYAHPVSYTSYGNVDFGTVKGLTMTYDMIRRIRNIQMSASYTLQFAEGTGSNSTSQLSLVNAGQPNLRTIVPLNYDVRHTFNVNLDYRFASGNDYNGPTWFNRDVFSNAGMFLSFRGRSGEPFTRAGNATPTALFGVASRSTLAGSINGSRLPWNFKIDARIDKDFILTRQDKAPFLLNIYLMVQNVLNTQNIINVYRYTGSAVDDGYLEAPASGQSIAGQVNSESFIDLYRIKMANPDNYSLPRRIQLGAQFKF